jgi:hypothetical protein
MKKTLISDILRGIQFCFSILCLGLAANIVHFFKHLTVNLANYVVAICVITFVYIIAIYLVQKYTKYLSSAIMVISDFIFAVFWLAAFGVTANSFGSASCSNWLFGDADIDIFNFNNFRVNNSGGKSACQCGKALIPFTLFNWLLFCATLGLMIYFNTIPITKNSSFKANFQPQTHHLVRGGIFIDSLPLAENTEEGDAEHGLEHKDAEHDMENKGTLTPDEHHDDEHHDDESHPIQNDMPMSQATDEIDLAPRNA